jgi:hypothetical protein
MRERLLGRGVISAPRTHHRDTGELLWLSLSGVPMAESKKVLLHVFQPVHIKQGYTVGELGNALTRAPHLNQDSFLRIFCMVSSLLLNL